MLTVTDRAAAAMASVCNDQVAGIRIMVQNSGCSGLQYRMGLETDALDDDAVVDCGGVRVFVDPLSVMWLVGATMDFVDGDDGCGFVFDNPNAAGKCACTSGGC